MFWDSGPLVYDFGVQGEGADSFGVRTFSAVSSFRAAMFKDESFETPEALLYSLGLRV